MEFDLRQTDTLLTTTRAVRRRLDFSKPVAPNLLRECVEIAVQAPNAENEQHWRWILVCQAEYRTAIGELYADLARQVIPPLIAAAQGSGEADSGRLYAGALELAERMPECPAMVLVGHARPLAAGAPIIVSSTWFGSIYPAIWSFQLALRSRGLGSVLTTLLLGAAQQVGEILELPKELSQVALLPVAYTRGRDFRPAPRRPLDEVVIQR